MIDDNIKNGKQADHMEYDVVGQPTGWVTYNTILSGETGNGCCICFVKNYDTDI